MTIARTGFYPIYVAFHTLVYKECFRFLRIWTQTLLPPAITMALYFIIFGKFIGSQLQAINGVSYIEFIVPGLIIMSVMNNAYSNTSSSFFLTKFNKSIEEMLVSPMPVFIILLGFMIGGVLRGLLVGIVVGLIALFFTHYPILHPWIAAAMILLTSAAFSLAGLINGIYAKRFDDIAFIPTFVLTPLTYLGGVFYSINQLPPFWRTFSVFNPLLDIVDTFRYGLLGISDINILHGFILATVFFICLFLWAWSLLANGVGIKT